MFYEESCDELLEIISKHPIPALKRDRMGMLVHDIDRQILVYSKAKTNSPIRRAGEDGLVVLLSILLDDGNIIVFTNEMKDNTMEYRVTDKGRVWMAKGGYTIQRRREANKRQLRYLERLVLALGTLAAGIVGIDYLVSDVGVRSILVSILLSSMAALVLPILSSEVKTRLQCSSRVDEFRSMDDQSSK